MPFTMGDMKSRHRPTFATRDGCKQCNRTSRTCRTCRTRLSREKLFCTRLLAETYKRSRSVSARTRSLRGGRRRARRERARQSFLPVKKDAECTRALRPRVKRNVNQQLPYAQGRVRRSRTETTERKASKKPTETRRARRLKRRRGRFFGNSWRTLNAGRRYLKKAPMRQIFFTDAAQGVGEKRKGVSPQGGSRRSRDVNPCIDPALAPAAVARVPHSETPAFAAHGPIRTDTDKSRDGWQLPDSHAASVYLICHQHQVSRDGRKLRCK